MEKQWPIDDQLFRVAESHPLCAFHIDKNPSTGSPVNAYQSGFFHELQIISSLNQLLFAMDCDGGEILVHSNPHYSLDQKVIIHERTFNGQRTFDYTRETTKSFHVTATIPEAALLEAPIYVKSCNLLLYTGAFRGRAFHPNNLDTRRRQLNEIFSFTGAKATYAPITIMANDPTGKTAKLWVANGKQIFTVECTGYRDDPEDDRIIVGLRDADYDEGRKPRLLTGSLRDIGKSAKGVICIGSLVFSLNKEVLKHYVLSETNRSAEDVIPVSEHHRILNERCGELEAIIKDGNAHAKGLGTLISQLRQAGEINVDLNTRKQELALRAQELELEKEKLLFSYKELSEKNKKLEAEVELRRQELVAKDRERRAGTIVTVVKTIGVVVPTGFGLWKAYEAFRKKKE